MPDNVPAPAPVPALPYVPAEADSQGPRAERAARTREEDTPTGMRLRAMQAGVPAVFSGSSLWHSQPPSLAMIWDKHAMSARYFDGIAFRWPRFWWGGLHIGLAAFAYLIAWVTHSIPLLLLTAGVLALVIWLA